MFTALLSRSLLPSESPWSMARVQQTFVDEHICITLVVYFFLFIVFILC